MRNVNFCAENKPFRSAHETSHVWQRFALKDCRKCNGIYLSSLIFGLVTRTTYTVATRLLLKYVIRGAIHLIFWINISGIFLYFYHCQLYSYCIWRNIWIDAKLQMSSIPSRFLKPSMYRFWDLGESRPRIARCQIIRISPSINMCCHEAQRNGNVL